MQFLINNTFFMKIISRAVILAFHAVATISAFIFFCSTNILQASPVADLSSPLQETRDAAAKILRATYTPPPRTNWDKLVSTLKIGSPKTNILAQLQSLNLHIGGGVGSGNTETQTYPLDEFWLLECSFTNTISGSGLNRVGLIGRLNNIWVEPPTNFTGIWKTYWANGQPSHEFHYKNGQLEGLLTTFYTDGSKCVVSSQQNGVPDGVEEGYHPSGRIAYKGTYKAGKQVGHWIWYKEDGSIESEKDYEPK
jgi:hypothetical protein